MMTLTVSGIGPASEAPELSDVGAEYIVVLSGTKDECKESAKLLFEAVKLVPDPSQ